MGRAVAAAVGAAQRLAEQAVGSTRAVVELARSGVVRPIRPDRMIGMGGGIFRYGFTVAAGCAAGAARHPDRTAIVDEIGWLSYGELHRRTDRLARALAATGIGPGTSIGVLCRNHRGAVEVQVAAGKLGADVVLLNTGLPAGQLASVADELELGTIVADAEFGEVLERVPRSCQIVTAWGAGLDDTSLEELVTRDGPDPLPLRPPPGRTIVLTSGTTGPPKGAKRPAPSSLTPIGAVLSAIPLRAGSPVLIAAPLLHTWGNAALQLALLHGAPIVLSRRFDPAGFVRTVERERCDAVFAVPVMLQRVLELPAGELEDVWEQHRPRIVAVSGSALPGSLATAFMDRFGDVLYNLYGSTEVSWVSIAGPADLRAAPGTAGKAPAGTRLVVLDDNDEPVAPGTDGRIFVGNDMPFEGYTREGSDVERAGGLLGTGDVGHVDGEGRLHLTGRADDMIVSGGENVHPGPVEELLTARPEVREAAVTGVDDDEYGQRLAAFLVLADGASTSADDVRGWVRAELSRFAVPRDVTFVDELPRNATGKVVHRELHS
ncbi:AMP-binding protein [Pseudonocardia sp. TRM90224]|uniref:AMP-binding protein n=1 Tax=Pseudonocardia sp. TRM90224 TaxID=2812678 RepID=UPI001E3C5070|nr:AMP-binding protein [Pseudonocardia sp. TRM90224]